MGTRVSDRIAAIAPSATLAVDAKAKALKAAGEPVIGFGAGEPAADDVYGLNCWGFHGCDVSAAGTQVKGKAPRNAKCPP